ncbi:MAG: ammonia-forming cytochrome c nitrite reductase subunit c552 [Lentisphaeria bacterium]|nr:ammonia-forming cytochrome c nitrite reductase subunit c552 [Lentisphaeria bacterium]
MKRYERFVMSNIGFVVLVIVLSTIIGAILSLLFNIRERKEEGRTKFIQRVEVTEDDVDPSKWGTNWPAQYKSYRKTSIPTKTKYGGHAGSEALPEQKIDRYPWMKRMFLGYAFSIDYRDRRGHAYMLEDQEKTERLSVPQSGSCLHCHGSIMPLYRQLGDGDAMAGFEKSYQYSYMDMNKMLHDMPGGAHPVSCVDCHTPNTMELRVTRPGFIEGIQALAQGNAEVPHLKSIQEWREAGRKGKYDPNTMASHTEMRSYVCGQCHVEYYCASGMKLTFPWGEGMTADQTELFWNETKFKDGKRFFDYKHKETGAEILKAQHPEFELWSQGVHARSGVSCSDCHMPYGRDGAQKVTDHWVRSPLLNIANACQTCHKFAEQEILDRVELIQDRNHELLERGGVAIDELMTAIVKAKEAGASDEQLKEARELQRKAQWRLDFIAAENSMGFHAPQEAAIVLGEAADYARMGIVAAMNWNNKNQE